MTVEGEGDFSDNYRIPWRDYSHSIKSAEVNVKGMTNASYMFYDCSNLTSVDVSGFDTSEVTDMSYMFHQCSSLTNLDVSGFDTSKVTDMDHMFSYCKNLINLDVSGFDTSQVTDMDHMFGGCINLMSLDVSGFDTSEVTNMWAMFNGCVSLINLDVSGFDTGQVTSMGWMFNRCISLTSLDVSGFDTSQVTDMRYMFKDCISLTSLDTSGFTGNISEMYAMFKGCGNLTSLDLSGLAVSKGVQTDDVFTGCTSLTTIHTPLNLERSITLPGESTDIWYQMDGAEITELPMYLNYSIVISKNEIPVIKSALTATKTKTNYGCGDRVDIDDLTVTYYDADGIGTKITEGYSTNADEIDMSTLGIKILKITYNGLTATVMLNVKSGFNGSFGAITWVIDVDGKLTVDGTGDFSDDDGYFNQERAPWYDYADDIISAEVNVTDMTNASYMFNGCKYITSISLAGVDTSRVTNMGGMFYDCESLKRLDLSGLDTSQVTNMSEMFYNCNSLKSLNVSGFDTSQVTNTRRMFYDCESMKSLDVSGLDTSQVTEMAGMFSGCSSLTTLDVSGFNTSQVTSMWDMFNNCESLTNLDVSGLDTSQVIDMAGMFSGCSSLTNLDVSGFDTSQVTDMADMFSECNSLTSLDVTGFDTSNVIDREYGGWQGMDGMFSSCSNLASLDINSFNMSKLDSVSGMFIGCTSLATIYTPCNIKCPVSLSGSWNTKDIWYDEDGNKYTELPQNLDYSILIRRNKMPTFGEIEAKKVETDYICGDTVHIDDLTVLYYDDYGVAHTLGSGEYATNVDEIDMSTAGEKTLIITYNDGWDILTYRIKLTVAKYMLNADNVMITLSDTSDYVYDGNPKIPEVTVVYVLDSYAVSENSTTGRYITLEKDRDYTVTYENNTDAFETNADIEMAKNAPRAIITGKNQYGGTISKYFSIRKAEAPRGEEQAVLIQDFGEVQEGRTFDLSGCFADYGSKTRYSVGLPIEDNTVPGSVLSGKVSVDKNGILTYGTNAGKAGDFAIIPIVVSFSNYKSAGLNVKIIFDKLTLTVADPMAVPESERQLVAGSKVTLTCETAGAGIYYTTGDSEKALADPTKKDIRYTEPITIDKDMYIKAVAIKDGNRSKIVTLHYTVIDAADKVLRPYAVPGQGTVENGTKVELKCDTPAAEIYYVTGQNVDMLGAVPVDDAHKYTEPIEITKDMVIKAIAKKDGMKDSDLSTFKYKTKVILDAPVADPDPGIVDRGSYISLKAGSNVNIYYTMDLSNPVTSGSAKLYEKKIRVDGDPGSSIVIKAVAEKDGIYSETAVFTYTVSENIVKGLQVMLAGDDEFTYTGRAITPAVIVTYNGEELTEGKDYTVRYSNNVKAADKNAGKAPKITVTGKGNLTNSRSVTFCIAPKDIGDEVDVVGGNIVVVQGKTASPVLFYDGVKLTAKDFVNPDAKKKYNQDDTVTITGKGNFEGTRDIDVKVVNKADLKKFTVTINNQALKEEPLVYDGEAKTLDGYFEVFDKADKSSPLEESSDYTVIYPRNNINAGKVKFTVIGLGEYYGTVTKTYTIKPRVVKTEADGNMEVNVDDGDNYSFRNGGVTIPDLTVICDGDVLVPGKDYKVTYSNNKKICTDSKAKCTISFTGNYKGSKALTRKFNVIPAVLDDVDQVNGSEIVAVGDMVYKGKPGAYKSVPYVTANGVLLKSADYKVSYYQDQDMTQVIDGKTDSSSVDLAESDKQTVYVKIEGKGNYEGTLTAAYNVYRLTEDVIDLSKAKINFVGGNRVAYTGESVEPEIEVMYKSGKEWKKVDADDIGAYVKVTYINNLNKGKASVMINGNGGKYACSKTAVFSIVPKSMK
ncbi:MAG: BspA family leucine-rich repeat surface protein [Lachnospiraceae bacterium]|nr:BspA family leucine-rich repeat surface protein [Lachnospiraceae bacterium]